MTHVSNMLVEAESSIITCFIHMHVDKDWWIKSKILISMILFKWITLNSLSNQTASRHHLMSSVVYYSSKNGGDVYILLTNPLVLGVKFHIGRHRWKFSSLIYLLHIFVASLHVMWMMFFPSQSYIHVCCHVSFGLQVSSFLVVSMVKAIL